MVSTIAHTTIPIMMPFSIRLEKLQKRSLYWLVNRVTSLDEASIHNAFFAKL